MRSSRCRPQEVVPSAPKAQGVVACVDCDRRPALGLDLVRQLTDLHRQGLVSDTQNATEGLAISAGEGDVTVRILAPGVALQHLPPGSTDRLVRHVTSNSASVVAHAIVGDQAVLFVPGDLDELGLIHLDAAGLRDDLASRSLVLPHHGGRARSAAAKRNTRRFSCPLCLQKQCWSLTGVGGSGTRDKTFGTRSVSTRRWSRSRARSLQRVVHGW